MSTRRINDNLASDADGVRCTRCGTLVAAPDEPPLHRALLRRGPVTLAGPQIRVGVPDFVREAVEFRQYLCPVCTTALLTEVAATADTATRTIALAPEPTPDVGTG
jgi:hypothetical protein